MSPRQPQRLTVPQCARRLGIHEQTVRKYIRRGLLRAIKTPSVSKFGGRHLISLTDLQKFEHRHLIGPDRIEAPRIESGGNGADRGIVTGHENPQPEKRDENLY